MTSPDAGSIESMTWLETFLTDYRGAVLFVTHDMAEAERLCARIGFIAKGRLVAEGTTEELRAQAGAATLEDSFIKLTGESLADEEEKEVDG